MISKKVVKYFIYLIVIFIFFNCLVLIAFLYPNNSTTSFLGKLLPTNIKPIVVNSSSFLREFYLKNIYFSRQEQLETLQKRVEELELAKGFINERIFPETQFLNLNYQEYKLNLDINTKALPYMRENMAPFYISHYKKKLLIITKNGKFFSSDLSSLNKKKPLVSDLKTENIFDTKILGNDLYISTSIIDNDPNHKFYNPLEACYLRVIYKTEINFKFLKFEKFYKHDECTENANGGVMFFDEDNKDLILSVPENTIKSKKITKFIKINFDNKSYKTISSGHRNPQGLLITKDKNIISTEHGPRGGDELNNIKLGKNYGWPLVSYGEPYTPNFNNKDEYTFIKDHRINGFEEPIYAFVPSIGISEIIEVPDSFTNRWKNSFLVTSLKARSIFKINFNHNFTKVITLEKIFIGKRIRDIEYIKDLNSFVLSLEDNAGAIGIINLKN